MTNRTRLCVVLLALASGCGDGNGGPLDPDAAAQADAATEPDAPPTDYDLPTPVVMVPSSYPSDDTAAIQGALDAVKLTGGTVQLAGGARYLIATGSTGLRFDGSAPPGTRWALDGQGATIEAAGKYVEDNLDVTMFTIVSSRFQIVDVTFDGNRANRRWNRATDSWDRQQHGKYTNIFVHGSSDFTFQDVHSNNAALDGYYVNADTTPTVLSARGRFLDCTADGNWRQGMSIIEAHDIQVIGGHYSTTGIPLDTPNGTQVGQDPQAGIDLEPNVPSPTPAIEDILISGVTFEGNYGSGIQTSPHGRVIADVTIEGCTFIDNAREYDDPTNQITRHNGISINGARMLVQDNTFTQHGEYVFKSIVYMAPANEITDNVIRNNTFTGNPQVSGDYVFTDHHATVTGSGNQFVANTVSTAGSSGGLFLNQNGNDRTCIGGNTVDGTTAANSCPPPPIAGYDP